MRGKGKPFKPGNTLGKGRPPIPPDLLYVQKLTPDHVQRVFAKFSHMTREELQASLSDPSASMLEIMVGAVVAKAAKEGDQSRLNFLLDRTIGKVSSEEPEAVQPIGIRHEMSQLTTDALLKLVKEKTQEGAA